ncbi:MAG TPA: Smr/MutS family protein [Candidatus Rubrimentiphilum sp.]|nr:Smr/MutS family protein [Candidatus Rubrimentiphilum sp.]
MRGLAAAADFHVLPAIETADLTTRAAIGTALSATDLRSLAEAIGAAAAAFNKTRDYTGDALAGVTAPYRPLKDLQKALTDAIDERGAVLDRASPALGRLRKSLQSAQREARDRVTALLRSPKYARAIQDSVVTIRDGRFVVPVKTEFSADVPGIVHDTSSSGQTVFVEPLAALETNNRVRTLQIEQEREIARILAQLSREAGAQAARIEANMEMLAELDGLAAKADVAQAMDARAPELTQDSGVSVQSGRHPLLGDRAVPQSLTLDENTRVLVISGPNMGGKTVALKMVGLFVLMTYAGMQVPAADGTRIGRFECVFADIGDEQSIAANTSTFSAHLARMRDILERAGPRSLVLVDEIGGGTEPGSGAALAVAMLGRLLAAGACAIVTTHSTELKLFAHEAGKVTNASVRFDPQTFAPTFHLDIGTPGQSLAFALARSIGIDRELIENAEALLTSRDRDYERALGQLADLNANLQREREALQRDRDHVGTLQENLRSRAETLERERRSFAQNADTRLRETLRDFAAKLASHAAQRTAAKVTRGQAELLQRTLDELHRDLGMSSDESPGGSAPSRAFAQGDPVRVLSLSQDGSVVADDGENVLIAVGPMKMMVSRNDLRPIAAAKRPGPSQGEARLEAAGRTTAELDVRGKRFVEAEPLVDRWIDEAVLAGNSPLRLIHGKGTGLLGRGLQEYLRAHPQVANVRYGGEDEGGGGVTIFELR